MSSCATWTGRINQAWLGLVDVDEGKKTEDKLRRSEAYLAEAQGLTHSGSGAYNETKLLSPIRPNANVHPWR